MKQIKKPVWGLTACVVLTALLSTVFFVRCKKQPDFAGKPEPVSMPVAKSTGNRTVSDLLFAGMVKNESGSRAQKDRSGLVERILIPLSAAKERKMYRYQLVEKDLITKSESVSRLISKSPVPGGANLFDLPFSKTGDIQFYGGDNSNHRYGIQLKHKGTEIKPDQLLSDLGDEMNPNSPIINGETWGYCIDSWWVTFDVNTGEVLSIEYIGSECYGCMETNTCGGGHGGDGGGNGEPPPPPGCGAIAQAMADATQESSSLKSITEIQNDGNTRTRKYEWICLVNYGGWGLVSHEIGVHKFVPPSKPHLPSWEWESLTHTDVTRQGLVLGGSIDIAHSGFATLGKYNAIMQLDLSITFKPGCQPVITLTKNYKPNKWFHVNDTGITPVGSN